MAKEPFPLDRGWAWAIVCGCFVCVFFMVGTAKSTGMFLTEFQDYFDIPTSLAAMLMGGSAIVYAVLAPVCIMLGQMFTLRQVIITGAFIGFVGMSLGSLLFSMEYVIVTFGVCFGIGNASIYGNCLVILGMYFNKRRTLANGLALSGSSIGQFAMPPFIEFLLETYGLQGCILLVGGVYLHVVAAACLFRPATFWASREEKDIPLEEMSSAPEGGEKEELKENGHISPSVSNGKPSQETAGKDVMNTTTTTANPDWHEEVPTGDVDSPQSPLVSPTKEVGFAVGTAEEPSGRTLVYRPYMNSTGSLCTRPLSIYGSSLLFEPHDLKIEEVEEWNEKENDSILHKLITLFDFSVMKSYVAVFITLTNFLCFFGYFNFVLFLPATVLAKGIEKYEKAILVSACGIGDLIGRLITGAIGDRNLITRYKLQALGIIVVSVNIGGFLFADSFWWMMVHSGLYGFFGGVYVSLAAVVIIDFVGLKHMPRLLAIVMLIQGVGASIGQPLLGGVKDTTGSFYGVIVICALSSLAGGLVLLAYPLVLKLEYRRPQQYRLLPEHLVQEQNV